MHEWTDPACDRAPWAASGGTAADLRCCFTIPITAPLSDEASIADLALQDYDAVLAFGEVLRQRYLKRGWGRQVFTWHEAADTRLFLPRVVETEPARSGVDRQLG